VFGDILVQPATQTSIIYPFLQKERLKQYLAPHPQEGVQERTWLSSLPLGSCLGIIKSKD